MRPWLKDNTGIPIGERPTAAKLSKPKVTVGGYSNYTNNYAYNQPGVVLTSQIIAHDINCIVEGEDVDPGYVERGGGRRGGRRGRGRGGGERASSLKLDVQFILTVCTGC